MFFNEMKDFIQLNIVPDASITRSKRRVFSVLFPSYLKSYINMLNQLSSQRKLRDLEIVLTLGSTFLNAHFLSARDNSL